MSSADSIAVIGMSCRFPGGADDPEAYWRLLRGGVDAIVEVPKERWDIDAVFDPDPRAAGKMYTRWGGFLRSRIDLFDPEFFAISPREAPSIDPQQRLFLEVCWEALERAGIAPDRLENSLSGVFAGIFSHDYAEIMARHPEALNAYSNIGVSAGAITGRVSYLLGLRGPSLTVDTASSSSLVAVHLACESLRDGRSDLALAGGVNLILTPTIGIGFCRAGAMSSDGRCRVFDAAASGYVRSEGCGVVVLKRLADAIADRDPILAVIRGTAVNQDGASDGLMAPSPEAQAALLRQALQDAGLTPVQVSYLEAHGTGTPVGDRAEVQAIAAVYGGDRSRRAPLLLGSAKTNLGHLESAAGIAGLIKVILALQHREIPPNLHFRTRNPALPLDEIPAVVPVEPTPWAPQGSAPVAGVSSFGFSGTNAHVLVEAAPAPALDADGSAPPRPCHLLCLSARSAPALVALGHRYREYLASHPGQRLGDVCFSAGHGRGHFTERLAIVAHSNEELQVKLDAVGSGGSPAGAIRGEARRDAESSKVAFLFPGGGAQYPAMGRELYGTQPTFRAALDRCAAILREHLPEPLCSVLWGDRSVLLDRMDYMQPALFSIEYALSELWRSWGIEPGALIGHSLGEYVAATVAGVFPLEDGLRLISRRAALMHAAPEQGAMAAIAASEDRVREVLDTGWRRVSIGAINGPESTMIAGDRAEIQEVLGRFEAQGVKVRLLPISHASHSPLMEPILDAFEEVARTISYARPALPLISNLTGSRALADEVCHPAYWRSHIRGTVRFADGMRTLLDEGCRELVEVGPGTALLGMSQDCAPAGLRVAWCPSIRKDRGEWEQILESLGALYVRGAKVDWAGLGRGDAARAIALPTYPFQRRSYWAGAMAGSSAPLGGGLGAPPGLEDPGAHAAAPEQVRSTGRRAQRILGEAEPHRRRELLRTFVQDELACALGHASMAEVDLSRPFRELGVDSFMSQVLRARLVEELGAHLEDQIPRTVLFAYSNVASLVDFLLEKISLPRPAVASMPAARDAAASRDPADIEREPIAIIGMACRFPGGADSPSSFWQILRDGVDTIREVPEDRWDVDALYDPDPDAPGKMSTRWGGFLAGPVDAFDARFFGISPREAVSMDPQQRLFLETAWAALENAGQPPRALAGTRTGVYAGVFGHDYLTLQVASRDAVNAHTGTGSNESLVAGRLSFLLGLQGPSLVVNTACSSSLVAIHLAVQSLRVSECDLALAGGVNLVLTPEPTVAFSKARMMAADGRCKTFDERADGYVRGEGAGVLVLRRLSSAVRAQDRILAVIRGTAVNQDGASNGLTAPSPAAQEALIRQALREARVAPGEVHYIEAHGTGTRLGDPIEVQALGAVLSEGRAPDDPVYLGSVKTNIGHLESAAGVAGVIKVVLALEHEEIPPHLHLKRVNPLLQLDRIPARVPTQRVPWARGDGRRIAGVSSFGFSGTNAHVVLEEAPPRPALPEPGAPRGERPMHVLCLSARTAPALAALAGDHARMFEASPALDLGDHCFSACVGRSHFERRLAIVGRSAVEIREQLGAFQAGTPSGVIEGAIDAGDSAPAVAFLFTGQGSQYTGMGKRLYQTQATFRRVFDQCAEILAPYLPVRLPDVLWSDRPEEQALVDETQYTQPALFALEYALSALWMSWGVIPVAVMGHSVGEFVAAAVAGVFSLEDGLKLTARRASLMQALPAGGEMASIAASEERVREAIAPYAPAICVAASNSPTSTVISGASGRLREALAELEAGGLRVRRLRVSHAFHSPLMDPMLDELERFASAISYETPRLAIISNLTGEPFSRDVPCTARYFRRHAREAVRFSEGMAVLARLGIRRFVEVGPHPALLPMGEACLPDLAAARWLPSLRRDVDDWSRLLRSLGELYVSGVEIDWRGFDRDHARAKVALPAYPFQRERYWLPPADARLAAPQGGDPILGHRVDLPSGTAVFESAYGIRAMPWLSDHRIYGPVIVPAAGQIARLLHLAKALRRARGAEIAEILFERPIVLGDEELRKVQLHVPLTADATQRVEIFSHDESAPSGAWVRNASGQLRATEPPEDALWAPDARAILGRCVELPIEQYLSVFRRVGVDLGPSFRWATRAWVGQGEALIRLREPRSEESGSGFVLHPGLLDSFITAGVHVALRSSAALEGGAFLPFSIESLAWFEEHEAALWCHAALRGAVEGSVTLDIVAWDALGQVVARIEGLVLRRVPEEKLLSIDGKRTAPEAGAPWLSEDLLSEKQARGRSVSQPRQPRLLALLRGAAPLEREVILRQVLASELRQVLGFDASREIDPEARLPGLGLDSWMAMELRDRVLKAVGDSVKIPLTLAFDHPSLRALTTYLLRSLDDTWEDAISTMGSPAAAPSGRAPDRAAENEPIAIIGMACRFPGGANDLRSYWGLLQRGRDAIVEVPRERWDLDAYFDSDPAAPGKMYSRWGGFLQGAPIDTFDASFFRVSAEEARVMDPQQRLVLEVTWEALEDAGIAQSRLEGSAGGVFLGVSAMDFPELAGEASAITPHANPGKYLSVIAGRVSYFLGMRGPSFVVDTACSSSLLAIHLACQSLRRGESTIALSGGVNLMLSPSPTIGFCKARMLSADGPCRSFDAAARGYSRGEGCGVIVLKRLSDAQRDGDRILSLIRGSAVNNNGKSGRLTMPNGLAQREVIQRALSEAGLSPAEVSLIEAHGTATSVGDAIEVQALGEVFSVGRGASDPLLITSVKTNLGHLEPAAGVAGVIKVVLALQSEEIPAHLHLTQVNPLIALSAIPAAIPLEQTPWKRGDKPRIAGVSAFAFQGTNAHVILAEAPAAAPRQSRPPAEHRGHVFTFSAKCPEALRSLAEAHLEHLERGEPADVFDACFTVNCGRTHFERRVALTCSSRDELTGKLRRLLEDGQSPGLFQGRARQEVSVGLRFEEGTTAHLGEWLFEAHPIHRAALDRIEVVVGEHSGGKHPAAPRGRDRGTELGRLARAHTWCELWRSWGMSPDWVEGIGEAVPGSCGVFDLDQAVRRVLGDPARAAASEGSAQGDPIQVDHVIVIGAAPRSASPGDAVVIALDAAGDWGQIHAALALLYVCGAPVDWSGLDRGQDRRKVSMPTYPFQRKRVGQGEQP